MRFLLIPAVPAILAMPLAAQQQPGLAAAAETARALRDSGAAWGAAIWPGFRPDTIPLLVVIPERGTALLNWDGAAPEGFAPRDGMLWRDGAARGAANTGTAIGSRRVAQFVAREGMSRSALRDLAMHEQFHAWSWSAVRDGSLFGRTENAMMVASYPAFSAANEAGMALEGRLLAAALRSRDANAARRLARQYSAAREHRARALGREFAEYEDRAEINEGLAEYVGLRGGATAGAAILASGPVQRLDSLTGSASVSFRLRYYSTGAAVALLLDRLAGAGWKQRLMDEPVTLAELLAQASGHHADESASIQAAERAFDGAALREMAEAQVAALRAARLRHVDSLMSRPGIVIELDGSRLPQRFVGHCGFDPWNTLQVGDGRILHTRWLAVCGSGNRWRGEFNAPVLQAADFSSLRAWIGGSAEVRVAVRGQPVVIGGMPRMAGAEEITIESPGLTLRLARADLEWVGGVLRVVLPAP